MEFRRDCERCFCARNMRNETEGGTREEKFPSPKVTGDTWMCGDAMKRNGGAMRKSKCKHLPFLLCPVKWNKTWVLRMPGTLLGFKVTLGMLKDLRGPLLLGLEP